MSAQLDIFARLATPLPGGKVAAAGEVERGARLSPDGVYRYALWRRWGDPAHGEVMAWVMLNPSTADATVDDPTIRRCVGFARAWGFVGMRVVNLFALRATDPSALLGDAARAVGPETDAELAALDDRVALVVAAWGVNGRLGGRDRAALAILTRTHDVHCLARTKDGHPQHPLYVRGDTRPQLYAPRVEVDHG